MVGTIVNSRKYLLALESAMNWSLYTADRSTHLRIVVIGFSSALLLFVIGIVATEINRDIDIMAAQAPTVIKAGAPIMLTEHENTVVR